MFRKITTPYRSALRVALVYALLASLWVKFSDKFLLSFIECAEMLTKSQTLKGMLFVIISTALIYALFLKELFIKEQIKNELGKKKEFLNNLLSNIDNAVLALDDSKRVTYFNKQFLNLAPFKKDYLLSSPTLEDVINQFCEAGLYPEDRKEEFIARRLEQMENAGQGRLIETPFLDGRVIEGFCSKLPQGGYLLTYRDVTERKLLMEDQARAAQLAVIGTISAGVAHEINNPISGIINYATILQKCSANKERVTDLSLRIIKEGNRIADLTKNMLGHAKKGSKEMVLTDLHPLIESSLFLLKTKVRRKGIDIKTIFDNISHKAKVDPQRFQQIIINLVDNAYDAIRVKEMPSEDKLVTLKTGILTIKETRYAYIEVKDNGTGMSEETLNRAKDTFFSTKPSSEGTGLGLSIVNEIISDFDGLFEIESKEGEFTKATVLLPIYPNPSPPSSSKEESEPRSNC